MIPLADAEDDFDDLVLEPAPRTSAMSDETVEDKFSFEEELGTGFGLKKDDDINLADFDLDDVQLPTRRRLSNKGRATMIPTATSI